LCYERKREREREREKEREIVCVCVCVGLNSETYYKVAFYLRDLLIGQSPFREPGPLDPAKYGTM